MFDISKNIKSAARSAGGRYASLAKFLIDYIETGDDALLTASDDISFHGMGILCALSRFDRSGYSWSGKESRLLKLALRLAKRNFADPDKCKYPFLSEEYGRSVLESASYIMYHREALRGEQWFDELLDGFKMAAPPDNILLGWLTPGSEFKWKGWFDSDHETNHEWKTGFENYVWNLPDEAMFPLLGWESPAHRPLVLALAKHRPETIRRWLVDLKSHLGSGQGLGISHHQNTLIDLLSLSEEFDAEIVSIISNSGSPDCLYRLHELRPKSHSGQKITMALKSPDFTLKWLAENHPDTALNSLAAMIEDGTLLHSRATLPNNREVLIVAAINLQEQGRSIFESLLKLDYSDSFSTILWCLAQHAPESESAYVQNYVNRMVAMNPPDLFGSVWSGLCGSPHYLAPYIEDLKAGLKSEELRSSASSSLRRLLGDEYQVYCGELLRSHDKAEQSLGLSLLAESGTEKAHQTLLEFLPDSPDRTLANAIRKILHKHGVPIPGEQRSEAESNSLAIPVLAESRRFLSPPRISWLDWKSLPKLRNKAGGDLDETAAWFLLDEDRRFEPLIEKLDRESVADFSIHFLKAWLGSDQKAKDGRWVLRFAGILGDDRVIDELVPRIHEWCSGTRRQLAELAVEAISRLPGDAILVALNELANRYKGRGKSMSDACETAIYFAADARGISL